MGLISHELICDSRNRSCSFRKSSPDWYTLDQEYWVHDREKGPALATVLWTTNLRPTCNMLLERFIPFFLEGVYGTYLVVTFWWGYWLLGSEQHAYDPENIVLTFFLSMASSSVGSKCQWLGKRVHLPHVPAAGWGTGQVQVSESEQSAVTVAS